MRVKICGITNRDDALHAVDAGADALGFNFADEAKGKNRYIDPDAAGKIVAVLPPFVTAVAVCVNESVDRMLEFLEIVDAIQLHGEEPAEDAAALGPHTIKAFRIGAASDLETLRGYTAGAYLIDARIDGARGGTGHTADWNLARKAKDFGKPIVLAGGLTPENVADAVLAVQPYAVDTASGVESAPGKKDHERVKRFIDNAKASVS